MFTFSNTVKPPTLILHCLYENSSNYVLEHKLEFSLPCTCVHTFIIDVFVSKLLSFHRFNRVETCTRYEAWVIHKLCSTHISEKRRTGTIMCVEAV